MDVTMPKWGMSMQEGLLSSWMVAVGDQVTEGQVIATVETEKVDAEIESPVEGVIAEILVEEGTEVEVGSVIAVIRPAS
jgi:pyruvate/2-oxoglutarate dehydrogenase complex dihydrolipoamide acyltransferase (E2) component